MGPEDTQNEARTSIGRSIARLVAVFVLVASLIASFTLGYRQFSSDLEERKLSLQDTAYVLAAGAADALAAGDRITAVNSLRSVARIPKIRSAVLLGPDGKRFAQMGQAVYLETDVATSESSNFDMLLRGYMAVAVDVVQGGRKAGRLMVLASIDDMRDEVLRNTFSAIIASLLAALLGVLASKPLQHRIVAPIMSLARSMSSIRTSGDFSRNIGIMSDISEVKTLVRAFNGLLSDIRQRDESLQKLAYFDPLTGLFNRARFRELLEAWIAASAPHPPEGLVMLFNIPNFRSLNDAFGHAIGDAVLLQVAQILRENVGTHAIIARVGGDEFAVLEPDARTRSEAETAVARCQSAFYQPLKVSEIDLHVVVTAGAVLLPVAEQHEDAASNILRCADLAMKSAKQAGAGRTMFYRPEMGDELRAETELGQSLRTALINNELQIHFQAQFDFSVGKVVGFEALCRWHDAKLGNISPARFIPVAERTGQIGMLGEWVLRRSCQHAKDWIDSGYEPRSMSVNVSPAQVLEAGFVSHVRDVLKQTGLPPQLLCLELTESLFLGPAMAQVTAAMNELAELGVMLALDDFGTGYSSLGYLSRLPFHIIKVDRSFVQKANESPRRSEILRSVIVMAHSLGMGVVAEGAETAAELHLLRKFKADKVQGYSISRPLPEEDALAQAARIDAQGKSLLLSH